MVVAAVADVGGGERDGWRVLDFGTAVIVVL